MNVSDQIISVINALCEKFGIAIDWTSETVIPYVEQLSQKYITYEIWTSAATAIMILLSFVVVLVFTIKMCTKAEWDEYTWHCEEVIALIGIVLSFALGIASCIVIPIECHDIITCLTFPEKQIFEYVSELISAAK